MSPNIWKNIAKRPSKPSKNFPERLPEPSKIDFQSKKSIPQGLPKAFSIQVTIYVQLWWIFLPKMTPKWSKSNLKSIFYVHQVSTSFTRNESLWRALPCSVPQPSLHSPSLDIPLKALRIEFLNRALKEGTLKDRQHSSEKNPKRWAPLRLTILLAPGADGCRRHLD